MINRARLLIALATAGVCMALPAKQPAAESKGTAERDEVAAEHAGIGVPEAAIASHTLAPGAQWFPEAGLGFFIHWDQSSLRAMNISWPMMTGWPLASRRIEDPKERDRIVRERDWLLGGKKGITPNEYWALAQDFQPENFHPRQWLAKVKASGFTYAVLTAKHHNGFCLWPSAYGDLSTKTHLGGRDLVKEYVDACREVGLRVGLYYSSPDWRFDRDYMNFMMYGVEQKNPELPCLDADHKPRPYTPTLEERKRFPRVGNPLRVPVTDDPDEITKHEEAYRQLVKGQVEELLTRYGKIDLFWFDGFPAIPDGRNAITQERMREIQPDLVINPRMHGRGDYLTFEGKNAFPPKRPIKAGQWSELCMPWNAWSYQKVPFVPLPEVLSIVTRARALEMNVLLGVGPMGTGDLAPEAYQNIAELGSWMAKHGEAIQGTRRLPEGEQASAPATRRGDARYIYVIPDEPKADRVITAVFAGKPVAVVLLGDGQSLTSTTNDGTLSITVPAARQRQPVDVIKVTVESTATQ